MINSPLTYLPEHSIDILNETNIFFNNNKHITSRLNKLFWSYHSLHNIIPNTIENFWSGHNFPFVESWEEIQISYNLICFGFYKQAMYSLRNTLELGLLSVYYNINDDGHNTVKEWLSSNNSKEYDTPKIQNIWKIIYQNDNIKKFQKSFDIKQKLIDLNYLHNYIHTKGYKYSNRLGKLKSNCQTFEKDFIEIWFNTLEGIIILVITLHLLKYPTSLINYDYSRKFGIDTPSFSHLNEFEIERLKAIMPKDYYEELYRICQIDLEVKNFYEWIENHEDITEDEVENQIIELEKLFVKSQGIKHYKKQQKNFYNVKKFSELSDSLKRRIKILEKWAKENNYIEKFNP